jgi:hypothetical protein
MRKAVKFIETQVSCKNHALSLSKYGNLMLHEKEQANTLHGQGTVPSKWSWGWGVSISGSHKAHPVGE